MNAVRTIASELLGLFIENWVFAGAIGAWIAVVAIDATLRPHEGAQRGVLLFAGLACILLASVVRASTKR